VTGERTTTPLGGAGQPVDRIVGAIVRHLQPRCREPTGAGRGNPMGEGEAGLGRFYADSGEEPGGSRGRGAGTIGPTGARSPLKLPAR